MAGQGRTAGDEPGSRERLVAAAARMFSRQGYEATVVKRIAVEGAAPMVSFYFHFPGGKADLAVAALAHGAEGFDAFLRETLDRTEAIEDALAGCARWPSPRHSSAPTGSTAARSPPRHWSRWPGTPSCVARPRARSTAGRRPSAGG